MKLQETRVVVKVSGRMYPQSFPIIHQIPYRRSRLITIITARCKKGD